MRLRREAMEGVFLEMMRRAVERQRLALREDREGEIRRKD